MSDRISQYPLSTMNSVTAFLRRPTTLFIGWILVTALIAALPLFGVPLFWQRQISTICLLALLVSGLNLAFGWAGELNMSGPAMYAAGAYAAGYLALHVVNDLGLALIVASLFAVLIGVIGGVPGLRLGGWALSVTSFFLVLLVAPVVKLFPPEVLGTTTGLIGIPAPMVFGLKLRPQMFFIAVIIVTSLWFVVYRNLVKSRVGDSLLSMQHGPALAPSLGISRYELKLKIYVMAAIPAGVAGALLAYLDSFVGLESFTLAFAIKILAAAIIAGTRSIFAIFIGAFFVQQIALSTAQLGQASDITFGALLIVGGIAFSGGVAGLIRAIAKRLKISRLPAISDSAVAAAAHEPVSLPTLPGKPLRIESLSKSFGGAQALNDVSFTAQPGQITALIGPNGSGKTTMLNMISGFYKPTSGRVFVGEVELTGRRPDQVANYGVARTFQSPAIPVELSTIDTVASSRISKAKVSIVSTILRLPRYTRTKRHDRELAANLLNGLGLAAYLDRPAASLALGTRRMTEFARSLASEPSVILLDEVAAGLDRDEIVKLDEVLKSARSAGATILLVEHNFALIRALADRVIVLADGKKLIEGTPAEVEADPEVLRRFLGTGQDISGTTIETASAVKES